MQEEITLHLIDMFWTYTVIRDFGVMVGEKWEDPEEYT